MTSLLESTLQSQHQRIREFADAAEAVAYSADEPRIRHRLSDTFSAVLSRHLAAVDDVLLPAAKSSTAYGRESVRDFVRHVRELEKVLHELKARVYGAATADMDWDGLWREIDRHLDDHAQRESALVEQLTASVPALECRELARRLTAATERAPTRPHPYTPHTGWMGRLAHQICRIADGFWDEAEGRVIPHRPTKPPTRPHAYTPHTGWLGRVARRIWRIADGFWDEAEGRVIPHRPAKPPAHPDSLMHRYMTGAPVNRPEEP